MYNPKAFTEVYQKSGELIYVNELIDSAVALQDYYNHKSGGETTKALRRNPVDVYNTEFLQLTARYGILRKPVDSEKEDCIRFIAGFKRLA